MDPSVLGKDSDMKRKMKLLPEQKKELIKILEKDVRFLAAHKIMDYSLLLGYHFESYAKGTKELGLFLCLEIAHMLDLGYTASINDSEKK